MANSLVGQTGGEWLNSLAGAYTTGSAYATGSSSGSIWSNATLAGSPIITYTVSNITSSQAANYPGSTQWIQQVINYSGLNLHSMHSMPPTPEEIAKSKLEAAARQAKLEAAASRADLLLHSLLDDHQRVQITRDKFFELQVNGKTYRINRGRQGNVMLVEGGKPVAKYCAHPDIWTPDGDAMIAQMMMLKTDEASFLKTANRTALV